MTKEGCHGLRHIHVREFSVNTSTEVVGSLLTIGDEILQGDIPNGNAHHIALKLREKGFQLQHIFTVGDREEVIAEMLLHCMKRSRFVIVSGGLGPTEDDRTNAAVSRALGLPLLHDSQYLGWLKDRFSNRGRPWTREAEKLTELPQGAVKIGREMAGHFLEHENVPCYFLPGVPHEMKDLMARFVLPHLEKKFPRRPYHVKRVLRFQDVFESEVGHELKQVDVDAWNLDVGYYPQVREVWVSLSASSHDPAEALMRVNEGERKVLERLGRHKMSGYGDDPLEKVVGRQLLQKNWKMAAAESCTGGLVAQRITSVSGSSGYFDRGFVTYSNEAKKTLLGVPGELLEVHGAVSGPVALAMAQGVREKAGVDIGVGITGIAGPTGGSAEKPVGTVFMACATADDSRVEKHLFQGDRETIRQFAGQAALQLLWRMLCR